MIYLDSMYMYLTLNWFFPSKLVQEGLSHHEISERVKEQAMNESESIYGTLYGTLEEADM